MAQTATTITTPLPRLTVKIKLPLAYGLRMWITSALLAIIGMICPHEIEVEIGEKNDGADRSLTVLPKGWTFSPLCAEDDLDDTVADQQDAEDIQGDSQ